MKKIKHKVIAVSILFGFAFWIIDTVLQHFIFFKGTFLDLLILKIPQHALYIRFMILGFFLIFGILISHIISRSKKLEGDLRKSEEYFRELLEQSQDVLYKRNLKTGQYEYMSPAIIQLAGYTPNEMLSMGPGEIDALIHPEDLEKINKIRQTISESPQNQEVISELESRIKHKNGTYRWISDHFKLFRDTNGHPAFSVASVRDITKQKESLQALQESEEIACTLLKAPTDSVFLIDSDGIILELNETAAKNFGKSIQELQGMDIFSLFSPEIAKRRKGWFEEIIQTAKPLHEEDERDGIWFDTINYPILDKAGKVSHIAILARDITERKKTEEVLHHYKHIVSSSTDRMALLDKQFRYLAANKVYLDAFNLTSEKLIGQTVSEIFGEKFFETAIKPHAEKCLSGEEVNYQNWFEFPASGKKYMDITYSPYLGEKNEILGFVVNARDITDRKRAEEELENIFNLSPDMVAVCTTEGQFLKVNPAWEKVLGYTQKELLDLGWTKPIHPDDVDKTNKETEKQLIGSYVVNFVNRYRCKDGSYKTFEWQATLAKEGIVYATARDITERRIAEEQLEKSQKELKKLTTHLQTVREEERTLVAHELHDNIGQALSALKMDIYMLEKKLPKDQKDISDQIKETKDLLDKTIQTTRKIYSELRPTLIEHFNIKVVLEDQLNNFRKSNNFSGITDVDFEGTELKEKDSIAIYRIVQEALNNVKWHSHAKTVNLMLKKTENILELKIEDDGIGIKEEDLNKSNSFGIIGMKERASFLGGEIEFKGLPEKGTTVTVTIPLNPKSA